MKHFAKLNKTKLKQLDNYSKRLNLSTDGEKYVLEHILRRDWSRDIILIDIESIKFVEYLRLVQVIFKTRSSSYNFYLRHLGGEGWLISDDLEEQKQYIDRELFLHIGY